MSDDARAPDTTVQAAAATLLAGDDDAQRLLLSWPRVPPELADAPMRRAWAQLAGVPLAVVKRVEAMLRGHGLVRDGNPRTAHPDALRVIQHFAAARLRDRGGGTPGRKARP